jgi:hypothetical protein
MEQEPLGEYLTPASAERESGIPAKRIRQAIKCGDLEASTFGSTWNRFTRDSFRDWADSTRVRATQELADVG